VVAVQCSQFPLGDEICIYSSSQHILRFIIQLTPTKLADKVSTTHIQTPKPLLSNPSNSLTVDRQCLSGSEIARKWATGDLKALMETQNQTKKKNVKLNIFLSFFLLNFFKIENRVIFKKRRNSASSVNSCERELS
jgi:hypothetical protein